MKARLELRPLVALLAAALGAAPWSARAEGVSLQADETYASSRLTSKDAAGLRTDTENQSLAQRYRLNLDDTLYPTVRFSAAGLLDWTKGWGVTDGVHSESDAKTWNGNAHLTFGGPMLGGGLDYDRREERSTSRTAGASVSSPTLVRETYAGSGSWRPYELPSLDLRLSRAESHDSTRRNLDLTTDDVLLTSRFDPLHSLDIRYAARYSAQENRIGGTRSTEISNAGTATWTDRFLGDRGNAYASYTLATRVSDFSALSKTATLATQRAPVAGLSLVEGPLDTPLRVTLTPNAALIDGVTTASAGVNLGYSASAAPVVAARDLGVQLQNDVTRVSLVHVWVDKNIEPVADQLAWAAYASDDNVTWRAVGLAGAVFFDPLQFRFEIPIVPTAARYLKVVTKPITRQLTTDPRFADIFVTELQVFDVVAAADVLGRTTSTSGALNASARLLLVRALSLAYDVSALVAHSDHPNLVTYAVVNGLSAQRRLAPTVTASGRVDRSDSDAGRGHEGLNRWAGSLSYEPLPTLGGTVSYSGQVAQRPEGVALFHSAAALARADLYEGISTSVNGNTSWARDERDRVTRSWGGTLSASVVPNTSLSTSMSAGVSRSIVSGAGQPERSDLRGILEGSAALSPFRALSLAGSVVRFFGTAGASTLVNFNGALSLFPRGDLRLGYGYQESIDTGAQSRSRTHGPTLRWTIRPGWYLTSAYSLQHTTSPAVVTDGQAFTVNLLVALR